MILFQGEKRKMDKSEKYYHLLKEQYGSKDKVITEIINLEAIMNLPKGTEHFLSDVHGEYEAFQHVLRNGSGNVRRKVLDCFGDKLSGREIEELISIVYYPEEVLAEKEFSNEAARRVWHLGLIRRMIELILFTSTKYTRSKVRKALDPKFAYIIEELLYRDQYESDDKGDYYQSIVDTVIKLGKVDELIASFAYTIQRLVVDHLHLVGDIYDRGPAPQKIMDTLMHYHSVDIQWGNHDVTWIGAVAGSPLCMLNVIRICARYGSLDILEDYYGINLRPLFTFSEHTYGDNPAFHPKKDPGQPDLSPEEQLQVTQIHQAVSIMQFKLESQLIHRNPDFQMENRLLLDKIRFNGDHETIELNGKTYELTNTCFQTIDRNHPDRLTEAEDRVITRLLHSFQASPELKKHTDFLMEKGHLYLVYNGNLLLHGCMPLNPDGTFKALTINGVARSGKELLDFFEKSLRESYRHPAHHDDLNTDMIWYLWTGECSSLFGKEEMTTFERYFIKDKATHKEIKNAYYQLRDDKTVCNRILTEFGLSTKDGHIINGHTPVKEKDGENPIKAGGKLIVIDGGFSKAYQSTTGIAGYTLLYNSYGMVLASHQPFCGRKIAIEKGTDIVSTKRVVEIADHRKKVRETNIGKQLEENKQELLKLLKNYDRY
ncbi:fructose-1,6-bisphosphatase [Sporolactobacillus sp. THM7-4]|nr:fructose-1,6-bisphosphatase [Sporolactobacillus sp. THM7-4]